MSLGFTSHFICCPFCRLVPVGILWAILSQNIGNSASTMYECRFFSGGVQVENVRLVWQMSEFGLWNVESCCIENGFL